MGLHNHTEVSKPTAPAAVALESWAQGYMVGSLVVMAAITIANMRRGVLLHKLILIELIFGMPHGTFMFPNPPAYGWYLSVTAVFLNISWSIHNVVAWLKSKPFLTRRASVIYIGTVILAQPYWILEIYANFAFFNNINNLFTYTRPYEAIFRDPWWIFTTLNLFWNIKRRYDFGIIELIIQSPRFGILMASMVLSIIFIVVDCLSVTSVIQHALPDGLNPFWKLAFVFKCFTDTIILDDFKTALDKLKQYKLGRLNGASSYGGTEMNHTVDRPIMALRKNANMSPYNESAGVTSEEKPGKLSTVDDIDLEGQLAYWSRDENDDGEGSASTATK